MLGIGAKWFGDALDKHSRLNTRKLFSYYSQ
jgi:hypothetical protein